MSGRFTRERTVYTIEILRINRTRDFNGVAEQILENNHINILHITTYNISIKTFLTLIVLMKSFNDIFIIEMKN